MHHQSVDIARGNFQVNAGHMQPWGGQNRGVRDPVSEFHTMAWKILAETSCVLPELGKVRHALQHLRLHLNKLHVEALQVAQAGYHLIPRQPLQWHPFLLQFPQTHDYVMCNRAHVRLH